MGCKLGVGTGEYFPGGFPVMLREVPGEFLGEECWRNCLKGMCGEFSRLQMGNVWGNIRQICLGDIREKWPDSFPSHRVSHLVSTKLYCLVTEPHVNNLPQAVNHIKENSKELNPQGLIHKQQAITITNHTRNINTSYCYKVVMFRYNFFDTDTIMIQY